MTYKEYEHELLENLAKLEALRDKWEATDSEVARYKEYIKRNLYAYKVIEWKHLQPKKSKDT